VKARRVPNGFGLCLARNRRSPKRPSEPAAKRASTRKRAQWKEDAKLRRQIGGKLGRGIQYLWLAVFLVFLMWKWSLKCFNMTS
jgi:hypothetical protein